MKLQHFTQTALTCLFLSTGLYAQDVKTSFKFDFGTGKAAKGYTKVAPTAVYSKETGYGFDFGTAPTAVDRGGKDLLKADFVTSDKPFYFSVKVPEGNYLVTLTLGDAKGATATTVKAESRRLMLENATTEPGKFITKSFVVAIKDRNIDATTQMRLKPRELPKYDWDEKLTLEFDLQTAVDGVEITKVDDQVTVFLAGNSTVVNQDAEPWASWGQIIPMYFKPGVAICNEAESGYSLGSFIGDRRLAKILAIMKAGDYVFVEFGHNDEKEKGPNDGAYKSYSQRLHTFATEVKKRGGTLVIVTPTARRSFNPDGTMVNTHGDYPDAARQVAKEENVPLIDLTAISSKLFQTIGEEGTKKVFEANPQTGVIDNTHFQPYGAYELAKIMAQAIKDQNLGIAKFLVDMPTFDPTHPDPVDKFNWPPSPKYDPVKPEGN
jgi:lysophospholipase L1-like esterase